MRQRNTETKKETKNKVVAEKEKPTNKNKVVA